MPISTKSRSLLRHTALWGCTAAVLMAPVAAMAQGGGGGGGDSATVRLIQLLIQKGILTSGQAASLLDQAQSEARAAPVPGPHKRHAARAAAATEAAASAVPPGAEAPPNTPPGEVRVTYVPQFVRDQIASQVRAQVMQQVSNQGWAKPDQVPDWIHRIQVYGDLRLRYQGDYEDKGNAPVFTDFNAINNTSGGFNTNQTVSPPQVNVTQNRDRYRVRARLGVRANIADWISSDVRIATGNDNSPVSENQTLGSPGDFSKYAVYVDRAYLNIRPDPRLSVQVGRTPNPYFVSDLMFAPDLNFDGAAVQFEQPVNDAVGLFVNAGAHPVFNTSLDFSSGNGLAESSHDAYLLAAQAGARWAITHDYAAKLAVGYFAYSNITGKQSSPCLLLQSSDTCSTDDTRPAFLQGGNTLFALRDIVTNTNSIAAMPQYYGLSSHFGVLDVHGRFDIHTYDPVLISLEGEYVKNLEYNRGYILARGPENNVTVIRNADGSFSNGPYMSGSNGYMARLTIGHPQIVRRWDWNASVTYKYLEPDSVVDAFVDPDFHLGGTNAKGYVIDGKLGVAPDTSLSVRWLSADEIDGPPNRNDVLQIDLGTKF